MKHSKTLLLLALALALAVSMGVKMAEGQAPAADPAADAATTGQANCRVGFVNLKRVLDDSAEGKKVKMSLEGERDKAFEPLRKQQEKLDAIEQQITALTQEIMNKSMVWDRITLAEKRNELEQLHGEYRSLYNTLNIEKSKVQEELNKKKDEMLKPLEDKLNDVMEKIGSAGNYCVVMDVSPPSQNMPNFNPILYRNPALDITDEVIAEVDKK